MPPTARFACVSRHDVRYGQPLLSAGSILSRFASFAVAGVADAAYEEVENLGEEDDS